MTNLTPQQKRELKEEAHALKPIVIIGKDGLTDPVLIEINSALEDHELVKIRLGDVDDHELREKMAEKICKSTRAELIQSIGKIIAIYRKSQKS